MKFPTTEAEMRAYAERLVDRVIHAGVLEGIETPPEERERLIEDTLVSLRKHNEETQ